MKNDSAAKVAIFGDWHGDMQWARLALQSAKRENITHLVHVGDWGLDWPQPGRGRGEDRLNRVLVASNQNLYVSPGNHDCLVNINERSVDDEGWITWRSNIKVLPRGSRSIIGGLVVGALGGAASADRELRTEGLDWWPDEEPTVEQAERLIAGGPVDLLVTHDAPTGVDVVPKFDLLAEIKERADQTRHLLAYVARELQPPLLVCGHWHQRVTNTIHHPGGNTTVVHVLGMQHDREGNGIVLRRSESGLQVEPLLIRGNRPGE